MVKYDCEYLKILDECYKKDSIFSPKRKYYLTQSKRFYRRFYKIFYILETSYFSLELIPISGQILFRLAPRNKDVIRAWKRWVLDHRPEYKETLNFGEFKGEEISDIPDSYIIWLLNNSNLPNELREKLEILLIFDYDNLDYFYNRKHDELHTLDKLLKRCCNNHIQENFVVSRCDYYTKNCFNEC